MKTNLKKITLKQLQVSRYFSTYSPPELRHLSYKGNNFCTLCRRSLLPGIGTTVTLISSSLSFWKHWRWPDRNFLRYKKIGNHGARVPGCRVDDDETPPSRTPAGDLLTVEPCVAIDMAQLTMNFDRYCALWFQKLYHRPQFTVGAATILLWKLGKSR